MHKILSSKSRKKDYHVKIDSIFLDQLINSDIKTYENITKIATGQ